MTELPKQRVETHDCPVKGPRTPITLRLERDRVYRGRCVWCGDLLSGDATGALVGSGPNPDGSKAE